MGIFDTLDAEEFDYVYSIHHVFVSQDSKVRISVAKMNRETKQYFDRVLYELTF